MRSRIKGKRRKSRECALQNLFMWDITGENPEELFYFSHEIGIPKEEVMEWKAYSQQLFRGVMEHLPEIDEILAKYSKNWKVERMGIVDRNILRLAVYELMICSDVPRAAVINEAVEMAKAYGDTESSIFINGNLDQICRQEAFPESSAFVASGTGASSSQPTVH